MQKWEYIQMTLGLTDPHNGSWVWTDTSTSIGVSTRLNQMGREGWELVSVHTQTNSEGSAAYTKYFFYTFKRPLS
jgi:hypothetical protein